MKCKKMVSILVLSLFVISLACQKTEDSDDSSNNNNNNNNDVLKEWHVEKIIYNCINDTNIRNYQYNDSNQLIKYTNGKDDYDFYYSSGKLDSVYYIYPNPNKQYFFYNNSKKISYIIKIGGKFMGDTSTYTFHYNASENVDTIYYIQTMLTPAAGKIELSWTGENITKIVGKYMTSGGYYTYDYQYSFEYDNYRNPFYHNVFFDFSTTSNLVSWFSKNNYTKHTSGMLGTEVLTYEYIYQNPKKVQSNWGGIITNYNYEYIEE